MTLRSGGWILLLLSNLFEPALKSRSKVALTLAGTKMRNRKRIIRKWLRDRDWHRLISAISVSVVLVGVMLSMLRLLTLKVGR
jgi:hypothetical protein